MKSQPVLLGSKEAFIRDVMAEAGFKSRKESSGNSLVVIGLCMRRRKLPGPQEGAAKQPLSQEAHEHTSQEECISHRARVGRPDACDTC